MGANIQVSFICIARLPSQMTHYVANIGILTVLNVKIDSYVAIY